MIRNDGVPTTTGWYWRETDEGLVPALHWIRRIDGKFVFGAGPFEGESVTDDRHIGARWQRAAPPVKESTNAS